MKLTIKEKIERAQRAKIYINSKVLNTDIEDILLIDYLLTKEIKRLTNYQRRKSNE